MLIVEGVQQRRVYIVLCVCEVYESYLILVTISITLTTRLHIFSHTDARAKFVVLVEYVGRSSFIVVTVPVTVLLLSVEFCDLCSHRFT